MKWQEPSEAWWLFLSCLCFLLCTFASRILNLANCSLWCLDIFSKNFFPLLLLVIRIHICTLPAFTLHDLQVDTSHSTLQAKKELRQAWRSIGNYIITLTHDVPASSVSDGSLHQFTITFFSKNSLHHILNLASQCPKEDKSDLSLHIQINGINSLSACCYFSVTAKELEWWGKCAAFREAITSCERRCLFLVMRGPAALDYIVKVGLWGEVYL